MITMILGIVGSPRKDGLTSQLVEAALEGARTSSSEVDKVYLTDYDVKPYLGVWESCPEELSLLCESADAIVLGSPVYWGDISGLTKSFMETVRISNADGKPGLGVSIAGGSGKGLLSGIQSIYHFFFHKRMRGMDPTPVSRFNFDGFIRSLKASGRRLADSSRRKRSFKDLSEVTQYYHEIPYMRCDMVDEFMMLAEQLLKASKSINMEDAEKEYETAEALLKSGDRTGAVIHAVKAYEALFY